VAALAASKRHGRRIVTTHWVLVELADALCDPSIRSVTEQFIRAMLTSSDALVVSDIKWFQTGLELYGNRPDKAWSLTDCISFSVMEARDFREALTGDHHFAQAGFVPLLSPA
jgi:uncharacterized protein